MNKQEIFKEKINIILIQAFGEWGAFRESTKEKNHLPDGSHITKKYANQVLKVIQAQNQDLLKKCLTAIDKAGQEMLELDNDTENKGTNKSLSKNP